MGVEVTTYNQTMSEPPAEFVLSFTYSADEVKSAWRHHMRKKLNLLLDAAVIVLAAAYGAWDWNQNGVSISAILPMAVAVLLTVGVLFALLVTPVLAYRRNPNWHRPIHLRFSEAGIEFRTEGVESSLGWELYNHILSDSGFWLLYYGKDQFTIIPRSAIPEPDTQRHFESLLRRKIPAWTAR